MRLSATAPNSITKSPFADVPIVQAQVNEMALIREKVYTMEQAHMALKQKYASPFAYSSLQL